MSHRIIRVTARTLDTFTDTLQPEWDVHVLTTATEALERRAELVEQVGGDEQALRERAATYSLTARELAALDEIDGLDFLLNG